MGNRLVGITDQAAGAGVAQIRTRERDPIGDPFNPLFFSEEYILEQEERVASYKGFVSTFRTPTSSGTTTNLFVVRNLFGSSVIVALRKISISHSSYSARNSFSGQIRFYLNLNTSAGTLGQVLTKVPFDSTQTSSSDVEFRSNATADGTISNLIAGGGATPPLKSPFTGRMHEITVPGQSRPHDIDLNNLDEDFAYLRPNQTIGISFESGDVASMVVNCMWEEFTLP